jgi:hypothetical protein
LEPLLELVQDEVDPTWLAALRDIFTHHPALMLARAADTNGVTLVHGDVNSGNILAPRTGMGKVYLIDRQPFDWSLTTWLGVHDLAYWLVLWWETEPRRQWQWPVLRRYHDTLLHEGISGYSWEQLVWDYKLSAIQTLYVPTEWCIGEEDRLAMKWVWFRHLQRGMAAYFDLDCTSLYA